MNEHFSKSAPVQFVSMGLQPICFVEFCMACELCLSSSRQPLKLGAWPKACWLLQCHECLLPGVGYKYCMSEHAGVRGHHVMCVVDELSRVTPAFQGRLQLSVIVCGSSDPSSGHIAIAPLPRNYEAVIVWRTALQT